MKLKSLTLILALALGAQVAFAQQSKSDPSVEFNPHWYGQIQGGAAYTIGETAFKNLISPAGALSIGYQFNTKKWSQDLGISSVRLYAQAQNLFCLTSYTGFDPEINSYYNSANLRSGIDLNTTPLTRTITFGANISF